MKIFKSLALVFLGFIIGCSSSQSISDQFIDFDLSDYKTFDFYEIEVSNKETPGFEENIQFLENEIVKEMNKRGLTQSNDSPELKINLGIVVEDKIQTRTTSLATDPFMYSGQRSYTWEVREVPVNTYKEGSLSFHLVDAKNNQVAYVDVVSRVIPKKQKNKQKAIDDAVTELFNKIDN